MLFPRKNSFFTPRPLHVQAIANKSAYGSVEEYFLVENASEKESYSYAKTRRRESNQFGKATNSTKTNLSVCDVCCAAIVEGKEDALQCEGNCLMWMHRYCAGVSLRHFKHLSSSSEPFVCMLCSQQVHRATVCQLQSEVAALKAIGVNRPDLGGTVPFF